MYFLFISAGTSKYVICHCVNCQGELIVSERTEQEHWKNNAAEVLDVSLDVTFTFMYHVCFWSPNSDLCNRLLFVSFEFGLHFRNTLNLNDSFLVRKSIFYESSHFS